MDTLNEIISELSNIESTSDESSSSQSTTCSSEPPEQQQTASQPNNQRHYCLIIFNNPHWSQLLRRHRERVGTTISLSVFLFKTSHFSVHSSHHRRHQLHDRRYRSTKADEVHRWTSDSPSNCDGSSITTWHTHSGRFPSDTSSTSPSSNRDRSFIEFLTVMHCICEPCIDKRRKEIKVESM